MQIKEYIIMKDENTICKKETFMEHLARIIYDTLPHLAYFSSGYRVEPIQQRSDKR